jgi:hypothetical protein
MEGILHTVPVAAVAQCIIMFIMLCNLQIVCV